MNLTLVNGLILGFDVDNLGPDLEPHLGLLSLAAVARQHGHAVTLYDPGVELWKQELKLRPDLYERIVDAVLAGSPDVVGLTALGCNFVCATQIAKHIKRQAPSTSVLLGGPHASILHKKIVDQFPAFDIVVRGEAEDILPVLLRALDSSDSLSKVPGITWREQTTTRVNSPDTPAVQDVSALPFPAYDLFPKDLLKSKRIRIEAGRGCPFACSFCSTAPFFGRQYRVKDASQLVGHLDRLAEIYNVNRFDLVHDLFTVNKQKVRAFCDAVANRGYSWTCSARVDCVDDALIREMADSGCSSIYYGVETGSPSLQKSIKKRLKLHLVIPIVKRSVECGMKVTVSAITGFPQETANDQKDTLDLLGECAVLGNVRTQLHLLNPEPGTELFDEHQSELAYDGHFSDFIFPTIGLNDEQLIRSYPDLFCSYYHFPTRHLSRRQNKLITELFYTIFLANKNIGLSLIEHYGGMLSRLFADIVEWDKGRAPDQPEEFDETVLCDFLCSQFGDNHPVSSVYRHQAIARRYRASLQDAALQKMPADSIALSPRAYFVSNSPDVPNFIAEVSSRGSGALIEPRTDLGSFAVIVNHRSSDWYEVPQGIYRVINKLIHPVHRRELMAIAPPENTHTWSAVIDTLLSVGILVGGSEEPHGVSSP